MGILEKTNSSSVLLSAPPNLCTSLSHAWYERSLRCSKTRLNGSIWHTERALQAVSSRWQHTVHRVLCIWWNTGWCHLIANSEYSTCLSVFWRNKRDGGNSCGGRERGVHRTSHRGCASPARLTVHTYIKANMSTCKYAHEQKYIRHAHTHTCKGTHTRTHTKATLPQ